jgi:hypothetical protein
MTTELKGNSMKPNSEEILLMDMQCTIERLENELLAATIRIDNDAMEIARLTPLQYRQAPCHKFCEATAFQIEIQALKAERDAAVAESLEQSRLLGMGSERGAALLGRGERLKQAQVGLTLDADRLVWAMNNMCQHNYTLFGMYVMNVGGTGDIHDCRTFIDNAMKRETK